MKTVRMRTYRSVEEKLRNVVNNAEEFPDGVYSWLSDPGVYLPILEELGVLLPGSRNNMWNRRVRRIDLDGVQRCLGALHNRYKQLEFEGKLKPQVDFYFDPQELKVQIVK